MYSKILPLITFASLAFNVHAHPALMKRDDCQTAYDKSIAGNGGVPEVKPFKCPDPSHTIERKKALKAAGAIDWDLAITMQETGCDMDSENPENYPFGDWNAAHDGTKTGDAANFSPFKLNWYQIRTYAKDSAYFNKPESDWQTAGREINASDQIAVDLLHQLKKYTPGSSETDPSGFYMYQRGGASATPDQGAAYAQGINYIRPQIASHLSDEYAAGYILRCI